MSGFIDALLSISTDLGYTGIVFLMAVESSFIPFPSEVVVPPAAYLATRGVFNIWLVWLSAVAGSLIGATFNYYLALWVGRPLAYSLARTRLARLLLISEANLEKAEEYFRRFGAASTFIGRLVPAVRQLISLPAGFARMPLHSFLGYTLLGSGLWTGILAALGYFFGANQERLSAYYAEIWWVAIAVGLLAAGYFVYNIKKKKTAPISPPPADGPARIP